MIPVLSVFALFTKQIHEINPHEYVNIEKSHSDTKKDKINPLYTTHNLMTLPEPSHCQLLCVYFLMSQNETPAMICTELEMRTNNFGGDAFIL